MACLEMCTESTQSTRTHDATGPEAKGHRHGTRGGRDAKIRLDANAVSWPDEQLRTGTPDTPETPDTQNVGESARPGETYTR